MKIFKIILSILFVTITLFLSAQVYSFMEFIKAADIHGYEYSELTKNVKCINKLLIPNKSNIFINKGKCKILGKDYEY